MESIFIEEFKCYITLQFPIGNGQIGFSRKSPSCTQIKNYDVYASQVTLSVSIGSSNSRATTDLVPTTALIINKFLKHGKYKFKVYTRVSSSWNIVIDWKKGILLRFRTEL